MDPGSLQRAYQHARAHLLAARDSRGAFVGELSSSALSTATATLFCHLAARDPSTSSARARDLTRLVDGGLIWLANHANSTGGYGDTVDSPSNPSTTLLVWAAFAGHEHIPGAIGWASEGAARWIAREYGSVEPAAIAEAIAARYGRDRTFSVPILTACALAGRLGTGRAAFRHIPALPFELAACPTHWFRRLRIPVVSYALPALIAIGLVHHERRPTRWPLRRWLRRAVRTRTLTLLQALQPASGGYLEAAPLTSFVGMSLIGAGLPDHPVVAAGLRFLESTVRADGSWPIDTNLDLWTTTLAVNALGGDLPDGATTARYVESQQTTSVHPYTVAAPGGFPWTDRPGGVPDADDTAGAILALASLPEADARAPRLTAAARWLLELANRDGGIPTFCRGFGILPFDQSSPDITAHALRAWNVLAPTPASALGAALPSARERALAYLRRVQRSDGAFIPLWFGNQRADRQEGPLYGTSRVLRALNVLGAAAAPLRGPALRWLLAAQHRDGGFGGDRNIPPTIEETALALEALAEWLLAPVGLEERGLRSEVETSARAAVAWLVQATQEGRTFPARPIGLYFARLWYSERLYPVIFTVSALGLARRALGVAAGSPR